MGNSKHIIVLGAGLAGLSAAYDLGKAGYQVTLLEAGSDEGGLAGSILVEGHPVERFYHFICRSDSYLVDMAHELNIDHKLHWLHTHTSNYYNGHLYPFGTPFDLINFTPIPFIQRIRFGLHILHSRYRHNWQELDNIAAPDWLKANLGEEAYNVIWKPLIQVKFGDHHEQISAAWMWHRIWRVARSREWLLAGESFGYFEEGSFTLYRALYQALQAMPNITMRFNTPARQILTSAGRASGVVTDNETFQADAVISTLALAQLCRLLEAYNDPYFKNLSQIQMIGVVCMLLSLRRPYSSNFWLNINDPRVPYNGVIEISNLNMHLRQAGLNILYVPYYMATNMPRYSYSDQQLYEEYLGTLQAVNPEFNADWVKEWFVFRAPYAQAICTTGFSKLIPTTRSPLSGLYISDSTQFYPEDRTLSAAIRFGRLAAQYSMEDLHAV